MKFLPKTAGANVQGVGFGLFMIVALQFSGILFFLRNSSSKESFPTVLTIFWFAFVGGNMLFLIIIGVWAGNAYNHAEPRVAAAFAFSVFDFLVNGAMIALTFLNRSSSGGGGFQPPPEITP